jgi:hypothetical protein
MCPAVRPRSGPPGATPGGHAVSGAETADEVARVAVTDPARDLADGQLRIGEQPSRLPHPPLSDPLLHGAPGAPADDRGQVPGRETDRVRNVSQRDRLVVSGLDEIEDRREQRLNALESRASRAPRDPVSGDQHVAVLECRDDPRRRPTAPKTCNRYFRALGQSLGNCRRREARAVSVAKHEIARRQCPVPPVQRINSATSARRRSHGGRCPAYRARGSP